MELLKFVRLIVVLVTMVSGEHLTREQMIQLSLKNIHLLGKDPQQGQVICARLSRDPHFGVEMLLGKPWRIYYSWNMDLENQCLDMTFRNATPAIINRIYNDMNEYLETDPNWDAATMLVKMGRARYDLLLFADQGPAGQFQGVPNVLKKGRLSGILPEKRTVPMLRFHLKLLYRGKYLLMADCQAGVTTLSTRRNKFPHRAEIGGIVSNIDIGPGHYTCQSDYNMN